METAGSIIDKTTRDEVLVAPEIGIATQDVARAVNTERQVFSDLVEGRSHYKNGLVNAVVRVSHHLHSVSQAATTSPEGSSVFRNKEASLKSVAAHLGAAAIPVAVMHGINVATKGSLSEFLPQAQFAVFAAGYYLAREKGISKSRFHEMAKVALRGGISSAAFAGAIAAGSEALTLLGYNSPGGGKMSPIELGVAAPIVKMAVSQILASCGLRTSSSESLINSLNNGMGKIHKLGENLADVKRRAGKEASREISDASPVSQRKENLKRAVVMGIVKSAKFFKLKIGESAELSYLANRISSLTGHVSKPEAEILTKVNEIITSDNMENLELSFDQAKDAAKTLTSTSKTLSVLMLHNYTRYSKRIVRDANGDEVVIDNTKLLNSCQDARKKLAEFAEKHFSEGEAQQINMMLVDGTLVDPKLLKNEKRALKREYAKAQLLINGGLALALSSEPVQEVLSEVRQIILPDSEVAAGIQPALLQETARIEVTDDTVAKLSVLDTTLQTLSVVKENQQVLIHTGFGISEKDLVGLNKALEKNGVTVGDLLTVMKLAKSKDLNLTGVFTHLDEATAGKSAMDLKATIIALTDYVQDHDVKKELTDFAIDAKIEREFLVHTGALREVAGSYDPTDLDFKLKFLSTDPETQQRLKLMIENDGIHIMSRIRKEGEEWRLNPEDEPLGEGLIVAINAENPVLGFLPEDIDSMDYHRAVFALRVFEGMAKSNPEELAKLDVEAYRRFTVLASESFEKRLLGDVEAYRKIADVVGYGLDRGLFAKISKELVGGGMEEAEVRALMEDAARGDISAFNKVYKSLSPGGRGVFESPVFASSRNKLFDTFFDAASSNGKINRDGVLKASADLEGDLMLFKLPEVVMAGEHMPLPSPDINDKLTLPEVMMWRVLAGREKIASFAVKLAERPVLFLQNGELVGQHFPVLQESLPSLPEAFGEALENTEGPFHGSGSKFLRDLFSRNLIVAADDKLLNKFGVDLYGGTYSGASDPAIQLVEMMAAVPLEDQFGMTKKENMAQIYNPDRYSFAYMLSLMDSIVEGGGIPAAPTEMIKDAADLAAVDFSGNFINKVVDPKVDEVINTLEPTVTEVVNAIGKLGEERREIVNMLCAKMESFIYSRQLLGSHSKDEILTAYANYVNLGNTKEGVPIVGVEAAANYFFGKDMSELNQAENAIIIGLIQAPTRYSPFMWVQVDRAEAMKGALDIDGDIMPVVKVLRDNPEGGGLALLDTSVIPKNRAISVAQGLFNKGLLTQEERDKLFLQIKSTEFVNTIPDKFETKIPEGGFYWKQLSSVPTPRGDVVVIPPEKVRVSAQLAMPIAEVSTEADDEITGMMQTYLGESNEFISTHYSSVASKDLTEFASTINETYYGSSNPAEFAEELEKALGKMGVDTNHGTIKFSLNTIRGRKSLADWECVEGAILLNGLMTEKHGSDFAYASILGEDIEFPSQMVAEFIDSGRSADEARGLIFRDLNFNTTKISDIEIGDFIVSSSKEGNEGINTPLSHLVMIVDKGHDITGEQYVMAWDANGDKDGTPHLRIFREAELRSMAKNYSAGRLTLVSPKVSDDLLEGNEVKWDDPNIVVDRPDLKITTLPSGEKVYVPVFEQSLMTPDGVEIISNPGLSVVVIDGSGAVEAEFDPTNVLGKTPVQAASAVKGIWNAFFQLKLGEKDPNFDPSTTRFSNAPHWTTDQDGNWLRVINYDSTLNIRSTSNTTTLDEALAFSTNVVYADLLEKYLKENPDGWSEIQEFFKMFGIPMVDIEGNEAEANSLAPLGQLYVPSMVDLGRAYYILANPDDFEFGENTPAVREALKHVRTTLMDPNVKEVRLPTGFEMDEKSLAALDSKCTVGGVETTCGVKGGVHEGWTAEGLYTDRLTGVIIYKQPDGKYGVAVGLMAGQKIDTAGVARDVNLLKLSPTRSASSNSLIMLMRDVLAGLPLFN